MVKEQTLWVGRAYRRWGQEGYLVAMPSLQLSCSHGNHEDEQELLVCGILC